MKRLVVAAFVVLPLVISCSRNDQDASTEDRSSAQATTNPVRKGIALVTELPAGMEGVELAEGGLRILKGYEVVKDTDSTFYIARVNTGRRPTGGGTGSCRCTSGSGKCYPGGTEIIICTPVDTTCTTCGLAVTIGGMSTTLFLY